MLKPSSFCIINRSTLLRVSVNLAADLHNKTVVIAALRLFSDSHFMTNVSGKRLKLTDSMQKNRMNIEGVDHVSARDSLDSIRLARGIGESKQETLQERQVGISCGQSERQGGRAVERQKASIEETSSRIQSSTYRASDYRTADTRMRDIVGRRGTRDSEATERRGCRRRERSETGLHCSILEVAIELSQQRCFQKASDARLSATAGYTTGRANAKGSPDLLQQKQRQRNIQQKGSGFYRDRIGLEDVLEERRSIFGSRRSTTTARIDVEYSLF